MSRVSRHGKRRSTAPLAPHQTTLYFLQRLQPDSAFYNNVVGLRLLGDLDVEVLRTCLVDLVARHDGLRTSFEGGGSDIRQVIHDEVELPFVIDRLETVAATERREAAAARARAEARVPFDLSRAPLVRALVMQVSAREHLLVLSIHHVVSDGWSVTVLLEELAELYAAYQAGRRSPLPPLETTYADYARRAHERMEGGQLVEQLTYWERELSGAAPLLDLPTDHPRPDRAAHSGCTVAFDVEPATVDRLRAVAREERTTPFVVMLSAFQALLYRYTLQNDILVGTPVTHRTRRDLQQLVGFFLNTLVLRARFSTHTTFREHVRRARRTYIEAVARMDVPLERVIEAVKPPRDLGRHPLFQVLFAYQQTPLGPGHGLALPGIEMEVIPVGTSSSRFDLTLCMVDSPQGLRGNLEYDDSLFEPETATRMAGHLQVLVDAALTEPEERVAELPLLPSEEVQRITRAWAGTGGCGLSAQATVQGRFQEQAARDPSRLAVRDGARTLTYGELNDQAEALARRLIAAGARPEQVVVVCLDRSLEMVVAILGVLKSGAAFVGIDPEGAPQRARFVVEDLGVTLAVADRRTQHAVPPSVEAVLVVVEEGWSAPRLPPASRRSGGRSLAYCIYTSGSTGRPKAVGVEHASAAAFLEWTGSAFTPAQLGGVLASTSPMFDCVLFEVLTPLSWGGSVVVVDSVLRLPELPQPEDVTFVSTVPSAMAELLRVGAVPASVSSVSLSGEALFRGLVEDVLHKTEGRRVYNFYGPSETTTYATGQVLRREDLGPGDGDPGERVPIGRPVGSVAVYVLDDELNPVPIGVPGQLYIGGRAVGRGYLGRPGLTAQRFVPDPFGAVPGSRLYASGDRVRFRGDGVLEFLGRVDRQIKVRGVRIEPGEVESLLRGQEGVSDAVVVLRDDGGGERLVAYLTTAGREPPAATTLRAALRRHVPEAAVPAAFVMVERLPRTPNGKVDTNRLPPASPHPSRSAPTWRLADPIEVRVELLWLELLGIDGVEVDESFFDVGGHSLLALGLLSQVELRLGARVPLSTFLADPTIQGLARAIRDHAGDGAGGCVVKISGEQGRQPFFCVHPGGAEVYLMQHLRQGLVDRPVYGLLSVGFNDEAEPLTSIEEMAARYIGEIDRLRPPGPYFLGGYSVGGLVAYEMAQQLLGRGEAVAFLGLFETGVGGEATVCAGEEAPARPGVTVEGILAFDGLTHMEAALASVRSLKATMRDRVVYDLEGLCGLLEALRPGLTEILEELKGRGLVIAEMDIERFHRMREVWAKYLWAASVYRPRPYPGTVTTFSGSSVDLDDLRRLWLPLVDGLESYTVDQRHGMLFADPKLAELLERCLAESESGSQRRDVVPTTTGQKSS